jgi:hypothetical protein
VPSPSIFQMSGSTPPDWRASIAPDRLQLLGRRRDQELEEEEAAVLVQPIREAGQPLGLAPVQRGVAVRVVAHEHLGERGVERLDVRGEVLPVLELELGLARLLHRHGQEMPFGQGPTRHAGSVLLVGQDAGRLHRHAEAERLHEPVVNDLLGRHDARVHLVGDRLGGPEEIVLERTAMVEREQVERLGVTERHVLYPPFRAEGR